MGRGYGDKLRVCKIWLDLTCRPSLLHQVGTKLRVAGASFLMPQLQPTSALPPLKPHDVVNNAVSSTTTAVVPAPSAAAPLPTLALCFNGCSPIDWDERLGHTGSPLAIRPLGQLHPQGGPVPYALIRVEVGGGKEGEGRGRGEKGRGGGGGRVTGGERERPL